MTPVTRTGSLLAAATVALGVLASASPAAAQPADPISGLVGGLGGGLGGGLLGDLAGDPGGQPPPSERDAADYGRTRAPDGVLRAGCRNYPYRYAVTTPSDDWTLETFLRDRTGDTIASGTYLAGADPARARAHFRFCRYSTYAGRFTIRAKVHWYDDDGDHQAWLKPSHFRLRRP